jgi:uncharacterized protein YjbJ (UPF0337 family)
MTMPHTQGGTTPATGTASEPAGSGGETTGGARGQIREVKEKVVDQAKTTFRDARDKATSSLSDSRRQAADQIGGIATAFHSAGDHLRGENQERIAGLADSLAGQVDQVAGYLRDADLQRIGRDVENLARRQPALVFGAALALGILGARFLKSSEPGRRTGGYEYDEYEEYGGYDRIQPGGDPAGIGLGGSRSFVDDIPPTPRQGMGGSDVGA